MEAVGIEPELTTHHGPCARNLRYDRRSCAFTGLLPFCECSRGGDWMPFALRTPGILPT